jgi:hypothetical protein
MKIISSEVRKVGSHWTTFYLCSDGVERSARQIAAYCGYARPSNLYQRLKAGDRGPFTKVKGFTFTNGNAAWRSLGEAQV